MQFIEFEWLKVLYIKELYDTIVIADDEFLIIGNNSYVNLYYKYFNI